MAHSKPRPAFKIWMETDDGYVFGPGVYSLLKKVGETGTLKEAATDLGMSYRYAWGLVRKVEEKLGEPLLNTHKGGRSGGGGAKLTERGKFFIEEFQQLREQMAMASESIQQHVIPGVVKELRAGTSEVEVIIRIEAGEKGTLKKGDGVKIQKMP